MDDRIRNLGVGHYNGDAAGNADDQCALQHARASVDESPADFFSRQPGNDAADNADCNEDAADFRHIPTPGDNAVNHRYEQADGDQPGNLLTRSHFLNFGVGVAAKLRARLQVDFIHAAGHRVFLHARGIAYNKPDCNSKIDNQQY
ncbi:hypothetical protein SDC9_70977 [bioreactor metagenome]|uniref:Uncharacterized protein n=1 Tax=bioreactor metagenome TaxID=1076179 RepID=A0A644YEA7_9ZZZZ